jgi:hypothetical protein
MWPYYVVFGGGAVAALVLAAGLVLLGLRVARRLRGTTSPADSETLP